jgi:prepilin-type N-terminal cleavage/methylation domain-containing protein
MKRESSPLSHSKNGGFTLLELLAAVAILAILSALLFGAFDQASKAWLRAENNVETSQQARTALQIFSREISQAILFTNPPPMLRGGPNWVTFVAPLGSSPPDAVITYQFQPSPINGLYVLYRSVNTNGFTGSIPSSPPGVQDDCIIAENLLEVSFSNTVNGVAWAPRAYAGGAAYPRAVSLTMKVIDSRTVSKLNVPGADRAMILNAGVQAYSVKVYLPSR